MQVCIASATSVSPNARLFYTYTRDMDDVLRVLGAVAALGLAGAIGGVVAALILRAGTKDAAQEPAMPPRPRVNRQSQLQKSIAKPNACLPLTRLGATGVDILCSRCWTRCCGAATCTRTLTRRLVLATAIG